LQRTRGPSLAEVGTVTSTLPPVEAPEVLATAIRYVLSESGVVDGRAVVDRPVFVGIRQSMAALAAVTDAPPKVQEDLQMGRAYRAIELEDATVCSGNGTTCSLRNDALFTSIAHASFTKDGELRVMVWVVSNANRAVTGDAGRTSGSASELFLARRDGRWKVVRRGYTTAS
jgi:hypothetical protein